MNLGLRIVWVIGNFFKALANKDEFTSWEEEKKKFKEFLDKERKSLD